MSASHYSASKLANGNTGVPTALDDISSAVGTDVTDGSVTRECPARDRGSANAG